MAYGYIAVKPIEWSDTYVLLLIWHPCMYVIYSVDPQAWQGWQGLDCRKGCPLVPLSRKSISSLEMAF